MGLLTYSTAKAPSSPLPTISDWDREDKNEIFIRPRPGWISINWKEMFAFRELLFFLVWRDIKVRYKQATLGVAWAVLQPLTQVLIFSLIFGAGFNLGSRLGGQTNGPPPPYAIFVF